MRGRRLLSARRPMALVVPYDDDQINRARPTDRCKRTEVHQQRSVAVHDEDPQVGSPTQMGVSTRGNLLAYLTTEVARTIGRFVHRVTVIWASRLIGAPAQHPSFPVPAQPPREAMLDDQCGAEPRCVGLNVVDHPFFCPRCERVKQEDGSLIGDENVRRDWLFL